MAPTVPASWIGGHFLQFRRRPTEFLTELANLGDVTTFRMGGQRAFFLNHPDLVRELLVVHASKFVKGRALQRAKRLLGEGLLTAEKDFHLRQRRMIQPAFHRQRIAEYARSMIEYGEKMASSWNDGETRDVDHEMMRLTLQIVAKTLFNADIEDDADEIGRAMTDLINLFNYLLLPFSELLEKIPLPQTRRFRNAKDTLDKIIYGIIDERRTSGADKGDLLSMLLLAQDEDDGGRMTDEQVRDEALTLFLAGHETTANALTFTWYLLSQNPAAEAKLHDELDRVLGDRTPSIDDYPNLKYTESVLAEAMRLYPPAWALGRLATEDHEFGGFHVPKDSLILLSMYVAHRDPRFWDDPESFRPERWEKLSIKEASNKFIYFPFGGGTRRCIGEQFAWTEGVLLIASIARKWRLRLDPAQKIALNPLMTLRPKFGMKMRIERR
ncbi:MAG: cytochrome P450 [Acidobacteria bacterium]|nr:cytochrome P450 [Acidobacteriota bacterium]MBK8147568.1 cytochrome P450 [Acidobacteriota bacterium]MBK8813896.1 cytochrome P450 [Acidobacteriota bacterium]